MVSGNPFVNLFPDHRLRIISRYISSDEGGGRECSLEELDEEPVTVMEIDMASRLYNG